jgi:cardiolipin synthase
MLRAIDEAQASIGLCMYIFSNDAVGMMFVEALERAAQRGVEVRVLIDDIGAHFTWNSILGPLLAAKIRTARFLPRWILRTAAYANLRNHRKILVVDGRIGFAGGMNIADGYWVGRTPASAIRDLQFRIQGPVVAQMQATFADDWKFTTGENLAGTRWYPTPVDNGGMLARGVSSGPDEDFDKIRLVILGALASARSAVRIVTPYFLPDPGLISALTIAALRGVQVDILIPKESDLRLVQWASMAQLPQVLEYGCRVWITQPPFLHTKLMIVDGAWVMLGSANWDPRSLRLNFEFNIECYDRALAATLDGAIEKELQSAERITLKAWRSRPALVQLRDGIAWLMSPLL